MSLQCASAEQTSGEAHCFKNSPVDILADQVIHFVGHIVLVHVIRQQDQMRDIIPGLEVRQFVLNVIGIVDAVDLVRPPGFGPGAVGQDGDGPVAQC